MPAWYEIAGGIASLIAIAGAWEFFKPKDGLTITVDGVDVWKIHVFNKGTQPVEVTDVYLQARISRDEWKTYREYSWQRPVLEPQRKTTYECNFDQIAARTFHKQMRFVITIAS